MSPFAQWNAPTLAITILVILLVALVAGIALAPACGATPLGDPDAPVIDRPSPSTPKPPAIGKDWGALPPVARPATVPVSSPDGIDTSGAVIEIDPALRRPNLMVFEQLFRSSPRRRASPRIAEGFSPTARGAYRI